MGASVEIYSLPRTRPSADAITLKGWRLDRGSGLRSGIRRWISDQRLPWSSIVPTRRRCRGCRKEKFCQANFDANIVSEPTYSIEVVEDITRNSKIPSERNLKLEMAPQEVNFA